MHAWAVCGLVVLHAVAVCGFSTTPAPKPRGTCADWSVYAKLKRATDMLCTNNELAFCAPAMCKEMGLPDLLDCVGNIGLECSDTSMTTTLRLTALGQTPLDVSDSGDHGLGNKVLETVRQAVTSYLDIEDYQLGVRFSATPDGYFPALDGPKLDKTLPQLGQPPSTAITIFVTSVKMECKCDEPFSLAPDNTFSCCEKKEHDGFELECKKDASGQPIFELDAISCPTGHVCTIPREDYPWLLEGMAEACKPLTCTCNAPSASFTGDTSYTCSDGSSSSCTAGYACESDAPFDKPPNKSAVPSGCQRAGNACDVDEFLVFPPNSCQVDSDCQGKRTCSRQTMKDIYPMGKQASLGYCTGWVEDKCCKDRGLELIPVTYPPNWTTDPYPGGACRPMPPSCYVDEFAPPDNFKEWDFHSCNTDADCQGTRTCNAATSVCEGDVGMCCAKYHIFNDDEKPELDTFYQVDAWRCMDKNCSSCCVVAPGTSACDPPRKAAVEPTGLCALDGGYCNSCVPSKTNQSPSEVYMVPLQDWGPDFQYVMGPVTPNEGLHKNIVPCNLDWFNNDWPEWLTYSPKSCWCGKPIYTSSGAALTCAVERGACMQCPWGVEMYGTDLEGVEHVLGPQFGTKVPCDDLTFGPFVKWEMSETIDGLLGTTKWGGCEENPSWESGAYDTKQFSSVTTIEACFELVKAKCGPVRACGVSFSAYNHDCSWYSDCSEVVPSDAYQTAAPVAFDALDGLPRQCRCKPRPKKYVSEGEVLLGCETGVIYGAADRWFTPIFSHIDQEVASAEGAGQECDWNFGDYGKAGRRCPQTAPICAGVQEAGSRGTCQALGRSDYLCTNEAFGADPYEGKKKSCYCAEEGVGPAAQMCGKCPCGSCIAKEMQLNVTMIEEGLFDEMIISENLYCGQKWNGCDEDRCQCADEIPYDSYDYEMHAGECDERFLWPTENNTVLTDQIAVGGWGGTCTCPDGSVYDVGDNSDSCGSLACAYGVEGECQEKDEGYAGAGVRVICGGGPPTVDAASNHECLEQCTSNKRCTIAEYDKQKKTCRLLETWDDCVNVAYEAEYEVTGVLVTTTKAPLPEVANETVPILRYKLIAGSLYAFMSAEQSVLLQMLPLNATFDPELVRSSPSSPPSAPPSSGPTPSPPTPGPVLSCANCYPIWSPDATPCQSVLMQDATDNKGVRIMTYECLDADATTPEGQLYAQGDGGQYCSASGNEYVFPPSKTITDATTGTVTKQMYCEARTLLPHPGRRMSEAKKTMDKLMKQVSIEADRRAAYIKKVQDPSVPGGQPGDTASVQQVQGGIKMALHEGRKLQLCETEECLNEMCRSRHQKCDKSTCKYSQKVGGDVQDELIAKMMQIMVNPKSPFPTANAAKKEAEMALLKVEIEKLEDEVMMKGTQFLKRQRARLIDEATAKFNKEIYQYMATELFPQLFEELGALVTHNIPENLREKYEKLIDHIDRDRLIDVIIQAVLDGEDWFTDKHSRMSDISIVRPYVVYLKEMTTTYAYSLHNDEVAKFRAWAVEAVSDELFNQFGLELDGHAVQKARQQRKEEEEEKKNQELLKKELLFKRAGAMGNNKGPINQKNPKNQKQAGKCGEECTFSRRSRGLQGGGELVCDPLDSDAPSPGSQLHYRKLPHDEWDTVNPDYADKMDSGYEHADDNDTCDNDEQCGRIGNYCCQNVCYDGSYNDHCDNDVDCARMGNYCQHVAGEIFQVGRCMRGLEGDDCNPGDPCVSGGYCNAGTDTCMFESTYVEGKEGPETACPEYDASCTTEQVASAPAQFASDLLISIIENPIK